MLTQAHRVGVAVFTLLFLTLFIFTSALAQVSLPRERLRVEAAAVKPLKEIAGTAMMYATSAGIDSSGKTYIVLYWKKAEKVIGYNLYRREKIVSTIPRTPLNGAKPIAPVTTCDELKAIIPKDSPEWKILSDALSSLAMKGQKETKSKSEETEAKSRDIKMAEKVPAPSAPSAIKEKAHIKGEAMMIEKEALAPSFGIGVLRPDLALASVNPCAVLERGLTAEEAALFDTMATANLKFRLARGLGFIDRSVVADKRYIYELRGVKPDKTEVVLASGVEVWAGHFTLPGPPSGLSATAGDRKVLTTWNRNPLATSYIVQRAISSSGPYQVVNSEPIVYDVSKDLEENDIDPPRPGFVDYQRWSDDGLPISHDVDGVSVVGPENYVTYYYQVASRDILDRTGSWSSYQPAMPTDQTPPKAPSDFRVDPSSSPVGLALSWRKVTLDINSHQELDIMQTYNIYRADNLDALDDVTSLIPASSLFVQSLTANPTDPTTMTITWTDTDPVLVPTYGEKDFWYRLQCVDTHGNVSSPSAAISGRAPDTTPPGPTHVTGAEGYADHITVMWDQNTEPDLAGYQIWWGVCDKGKPYRPGRGEKDEYQGMPCDFFLVGEILVKEAEKRLAETGNIYYEDFSVPEGSPICYAYWVRAFDMARNLYPGKWSSGCPDTGEYICQRLYEETPPPVPVISALKARSKSVLIEWISSPIQDLRAFHMYRSEKEDDTPVFVGCVLSDGTPWSGKWEGMTPVCEDIPAEPNPTAVKGSFEDKGLEPNQVFWYRVSAVDWLGNESEAADIKKIPAISTFTYSKDLPGAPVVLPPSGAASLGCGLVVRWTPSFDPAKFEGFLVFRSTSKAGPYRQVSPVMEMDEFVDETALRGVSYWYRVQAMDKAGKLSEPSLAVNYSY